MRSPSPTSFRSKRGESPSPRLDRQRRATYSKAQLRLRPDRILLGDARGGEVLDLLEAMNTGHDGSMSTLHANDTRDALDRIELLMALSGVELPLSAARGYIASAIQILIHVGRLPSGERKVLRISELCGVSGGQYQLEDLFVYRMAGCDETGRVQGSSIPRGPSRCRSRGWPPSASSFPATCFCRAS